MKRNNIAIFGFVVGLVIFGVSDAAKLCSGQGSCKDKAVVCVNHYDCMLGPDGCPSCQAPTDPHAYEFEFSKFITKFDKKYSSVEEYNKRLSIFKKNYDTILTLQNLSWDSGINEFADMQWEEFRDSKLCYFDIPRRKNHTKNDYCAHEGEHCIDKSCCDGLTCSVHLVTEGVRTRICKASYKNDASLDWRTKGVVNTAKDQAQCGSCWAFSAIGSLESRCSILKGSLYSLSEQQLVDCSGPQGNEACNGGTMDAAYDYLKINGGSCSEKDYSYTAKEGTCKTNCPLYCKISSYVDVSQSDAALEKAVNSGPIAVAIEANTKFQFYTGGIYDDATCGTSLNHGVVIVGYTPDYWIVRNSWGSNWGTEHGYIHMKRGKNLCGIETSASYPEIV